MYKWDLKSLYSSQESFYSDMTLVRNKINKLNECREFKIDSSSFYDLINECFSIREINHKTLLYGSLNYYLDINNKSCITMKKQAEELDELVKNETNFIDELIIILDEDKLNEFYKENKDLKKYKYYIDNTRREKNHLLNSYDMVSVCNLNINNNLIEYNNLIKNMNFGNINNIKIDNININNYLIDKDREIRKDIYSKLNSTYLDKKDKFFNIFNEIIINRKNIAKEEKYNSVLESELFKDDIKDILVSNLINSVNNNINLMNDYLRIKTKYLNISNPTLYDINISIVEDLDNNYDIDTSLNILHEVFKIYDKKYIEIIDELIEKKHLDLEVDNKKHPTITFSWDTYLFTNYKNKYIDLKNLAHELGHLVNSYLSIEEQPYIYSDSTIFVGEIASLVNEILLNDYLYKNSKSKNEKIFFLSKIIENFISQVYRQTLYTEFENIIYNEKISLDILNSRYLELINKYYGNVLEIDDNVKCEWMRVGHLYRRSYYVYKYAVDYILAFSVVSKLKNKNYISKYMNFLSSGSSMSNYDLLKKIDLDIYDEELMNDSFNLFNNYIEDLKDIMEDE